MQIIHSFSRFCVCILLPLTSYAPASPAGLQARLLSACKSGNLPLASRLLAKGAKINARAGEFTPLMAAAQAGQTEVVAFLLKNNANVNAKHAPGSLTALMYAKNYACVKALLRAGSNANDANVDGETVLLHWLGRKDKEATKVSRLLISKGADVNAATITNETALMVAVEAGNSNTARLLLAKGARVNEEDEEGATALSRAISLHRADLVALLKRAGVTPKSR